MIALQIRSGQREVIMKTHIAYMNSKESSFHLISQKNIAVYTILKMVAKEDNIY